MSVAGNLPLVWSGAVLLAATAAGWLGLRNLRRARELEDTPLSRVRSAAQGYVELLGRGRLMPGPPIVSPLTGTPCVWWRCRVWVSSDNDTQTLYDETSDDLFHLSDTSGDCIVDPVGARVQPDISRTWRGLTPKPARAPRSYWDALLTSGHYRYSEQLISRDALITARGWFRTQAAVQASDEQRDLAALLGEWKRDRNNLLRRFDTNHNGRIDPDEWEAARAAALEEIRAQYAGQQALPDVNVLGRPPDHREFLLCAVPRQALRQRYRRRGQALIGGAALAVLYTALLSLRHV
jgi:hypothetical protein